MDPRPLAFGPLANGFESVHSSPDQMQVGYVLGQQFRTYRAYRAGCAHHGGLRLP